MIVGVSLAQWAIGPCPRAGMASSGCAWAWCNECSSPGPGRWYRWRLPSKKRRSGSRSPSSAARWPLRGCVCAWIARAWQVWLFCTVSGAVLFGAGGLVIFGSDGRAVLLGLGLGTFGGAVAGLVMLTPYGRGRRTPRRPHRPPDSGSRARRGPAGGARAIRPIDAQDRAVAIFPSRAKALGLLGVCALLIALSILRALTMHALDAVAVAGFVLFGTGVLLALIPLGTSWPLLRATDEGIDYYTWMEPWAHPLLRRVHVPWDAVRAIEVRSGAPGFLGRSALTLKLSGPNPNVYFQTWQVPHSAEETLRELARRFQRPIERHGVIIRGIE